MLHNLRRMAAASRQRTALVRELLKNQDMFPPIGLRLVPSNNTAPMHATRRTGGGARRSLHERVLLRDAAREVNGWSLNVSRGGLRIIVEDVLQVGEEFELAVGSSEPYRAVIRRGRVVWTQQERDGTIAGIQFVGQRDAVTLV